MESPDLRAGDAIAWPPGTQPARFHERKPGKSARQLQPPAAGVPTRPDPPDELTAAHGPLRTEEDPRRLPPPVRLHPPQEAPTVVPPRPQPHRALPPQGARRLREGGALHPRDRRLHARVAPLGIPRPPSRADRRRRPQGTRATRPLRRTMSRGTLPPDLRRRGGRRHHRLRQDGRPHRRHPHVRALEFLARLLAHVPRKSEIYVRYCGAYSVRRRAASLTALGVVAGPISSEGSGTSTSRPAPPAVGR